MYFEGLSIEVEDLDKFLRLKNLSLDDWVEFKFLAEIYFVGLSIKVDDLDKFLILRL